MHPCGCRFDCVKAVSLEAMVLHLSLHAWFFISLYIHGLSLSLYMHSSLSTCMVLSLRAWLSPYMHSSISTCIVLSLCMVLSTCMVLHLSLHAWFSLYMHGSLSTCMVLHLSLHAYRGRTLIVNQLGASKLWHKFACFDPPMSLVNTLQKMLNDFFLARLALDSGNIFISAYN